MAQIDPQQRPSGANVERERTALEEVFTGDNDKFHTDRQSILKHHGTAAKGWSCVRSSSFQIKHGNMQNHSAQTDGRAHISSTWCETSEILIDMKKEGQRSIMLSSVKYSITICSRLLDFEI